MYSCVARSSSFSVNCTAGPNFFITSSLIFAGLPFTVFHSSSSIPCLPTSVTFAGLFFGTPSASVRRSVRFFSNPSASLALAMALMVWNVRSPPGL